MLRLRNFSNQEGGKKTKRSIFQISGYEKLQREGTRKKVVVLAKKSGSLTQGKKGKLG